MAEKATWQDVTARQIKAYRPRSGRYLFRHSSALLLVTACALPHPAASAQAKFSAATPRDDPPKTWAVDAAANEIPVIERGNVYMRYRMHVVDEKGVMLRDVIESRDGTVARLIKRDDRPLTDTEDKAEQSRLNDLLNSPSLYQKHMSNDVAGKKRAIDLIKMMPDAMLFSYVPGQPQVESPAGEQVVLDFTPNPNWKPPTMPSEGLTGLRGRVWIDIKTRHMVRMEGEIFQGINVGWGMLAHVFPGGKLALEQVPTVGDRWLFSRFNEQIAVRALMLKTIRQNADVNTSGYQTVDAMSYQDAIRMLLGTPLPK